MPPLDVTLDVGASFGRLPTDPYETAHLVIVNEGRPCPPPDEMKKLSHLIVNSGSLCFVLFQISIFSHSDVDRHLLVASMHQDME